MNKGNYLDYLLETGIEVGYINFWQKNVIKNKIFLIYNPDQFQLGSLTLGIY